ncbi:transcription intermediary factor 1-alpha-like [Mytilus californianus]|uniref:transcription intermediary factor 1-alpha-like n=1 Tax=Mytilus californianus TaxID=6549 RepID=UPI0022461D9F|nr:transcription intermediary factor 1-alpha-like [Mytilus californianus]
MASNKPIPCGPCQEGKVNTKADIWCYNCVEGLCSTCSGHHKRFKGTRDHKTIDIKSYKPSIRTIKTECDKHGRQLNLYCPSHLMPCCDECISTSHSQCTGINSLVSVVDNTKIEKSQKKIDNDINSTLHILKEIMNNKSENMIRGEQQVNSIKKTIAKYRKKINKHLDDLEKKLCQETDTILNQEKSKASDIKTKIEGKQKKLKKMKDHLHTVISHTSKLQSFLGVHQIEQEVHQCQQYVDDLENDERTKEFDIKITQNDEIESIQSNLISLEPLGEIMVVKKNIDLNRETSVRRKAQVRQTREQSIINNMTMNIETKIKTNGGGGG